jgi:hypothetical protein
LLLRSLAPLMFLGAILVLIYGVMKFLKKQDRVFTPPKQVVATADPAQAGAGAPPLVPPPMPEPAETLRVSAEPALAQSEQARTLARDALVVLEEFLKAKNLDQRLGIIETREKEDQLVTTILSAPLPEYRNLYMESQKSFPVEKIVDVFYSLEFIRADGSADPQLVVVRKRGDASPKVLVDPFLDLYGGRLAAYASAPQGMGASFHAIVYPLPSCNDPRIPDRQKKLTLRLLPHGNSDKMILAYASRISKIGDMLSRESYDLSYGKAQPCVVLLGWNTEEEEDEPYLEALDIRAANWNP